MTALLNFALSLSAIILAFFGGYVIADVGLYQVYLLETVQELLSIVNSWTNVVAEVYSYTLQILDRKFFSRINDPLLI